MKREDLVGGLKKLAVITSPAAAREIARGLLASLGEDGSGPKEAAVTAGALAAVLDRRKILVRVREPFPDGTAIAVAANPEDLAVQLLTAISPDLTGEGTVPAGGDR